MKFTGPADETLVIMAKNTISVHQLTPIECQCKFFVSIRVKAGQYNPHGSTKAMIEPFSALTTWAQDEKPFRHLQMHLRCQHVSVLSVTTTQCVLLL